jgi:hypothetical protein
LAVDFFFKNQVKVLDKGMKNGVTYDSAWESRFGFRGAAPPAAPAMFGKKPGPAGSGF